MVGGGMSNSGVRSRVGIYDFSILTLISPFPFSPISVNVPSIATLFFTLCLSILSIRAFSSVSVT